MCIFSEFDRQKLLQFRHKQGLLLAGRMEMRLYLAKRCANSFFAPFRMVIITEFSALGASLTFTFKRSRKQTNLGCFIYPHIDFFEDGLHPSQVGF